MTHTIEATGWTLIHFCWQAAVIAGVYGILGTAFARRASQTRYVLALSALLAMLAAAVFTFAWEMRPSATASALTGTPSAVANAMVSGDFPRMVAPGIAPNSQPSATGSLFVNSLPGLMGWIDGFWFVGVLALSVRGLGGWWLIHRLRVSATSQAPEAVGAAFRRISHALGLRRTVLLRVSSAIAGPVTVGALRAIVLLPISALTSLGPDEIEVVLAHELAHVRRADFLWNLVQTLVETLFFFHPAVWWISGRIRHERELCCDDLALQVCPNPVVYASALFHLEEQRSRHMRLAMALDGHQSPQTLRMRIARILGESMPLNATRSIRPFSAAAVFAALIVILLPAPQLIAGLRPSASPAGSISAQAPSPDPHPAVSTLSSHIAVSKPHPGTAPAQPGARSATAANCSGANAERISRAARFREFGTQVYLYRPHEGGRL